jgi:hypothetical protein
MAPESNYNLIEERNTDQRKILSQKKMKMNDFATCRPF